MFLRTDRLPGRVARTLGRLFFALAGVGLFAAPLCAQTVAPGFTAAYTVHPIGSVAGLPTNYGGLTFKRGDPNTILIGGAANSDSGRTHAVPVVRGAGNHIVSFGTPVAQGYGAKNDGGIDYSPTGLLLYTKYSDTRVGQVKPGATADSKVSDLRALGVAQSPGALAFVPTGLNGAGRLKVASYSGGQFYDVAYTSDGNGTYNLTAATQIATLQGGPEGMIYAPKGSPLLRDGTLLVTEYNANKVAAYDTDGNGNPVLASRRDFITGLTGGEGAAIDPVTGDFLFSTFGGGNQVIRVEGFLPPPPKATVTLSSSLNPSRAGQSVTLTATVTGVAPVSGTVRFQDGTTDVAGCASVPIAAGTAACTTAGLAVGDRLINAIFGGNPANSANNATLTQTVNPANYAPTAGPASYGTFQNQSASGTLVASDADGNPLVFALVTQPLHGSVVLDNAATGAFTYTPAAGYTGSDSFTYKANDGQVDSNIATAQITVRPVPVLPNQPPLAGRDLYQTTKNVPMSVVAPGVLANDFDQDSASVSVATLPSSGPSHGTVAANGGGAFTYTPAANYVGVDSFQYTITDGTLTAVGTVVIDVRDANTPPVAHDDSYATPSNTKLTVAGPGLLANDSDPDGNQPLRVVLVSLPTLGTVTLGAGGAFDYSPGAAPCNADRTDSFTYHANDSVANSNLATVTIRINCVNRPPVAQPDRYTIQQGAQLAIPAPGFLVNDSDPDGNSLSAVIVTPPTRGAFAPSANGGFFYNAPLAGTDTFTYRATDGALQSAPTTVTITVTPVNQAPLGANDSFRTTKNAVLTVAAPGVLGNDSDAEGNPLTAGAMTQPANGSLQFNPDGSLTYLPNPNFVGLDSFIYRPNDGAAAGNDTLVVIEVADSNTAPKAADDQYTVPHNGRLSVPAPGLLANDIDIDGNQPLRVNIARQPVLGTLALGPGGGFEYTPRVGPCSSDSNDSFTYYANDSVVDSNLATVTIHVHCVNQPPIAVADSYTVPQGIELRIDPTGILANDSDPDGNAIKARIVAQPTRGAFAPRGDGSFSYFAPLAGTDTFTYRATDGALESAPATVTITVSAVNTAPLAGADSYRTTKNAALDNNAPGILGNDIDQEGNPLSALLVAGPSHGQLQLNANGSFTYAPATNYVGLDSFTYRANDGALASSVATVLIEVADANTLPVAGNDSFSGTYGADLVIAGPGLLANDSDADGNQPLVAVLASQPSYGTLVLGAGGGFAYYPITTGACTADLVDSFTYYANDSIANSAAPATVTLNLFCLLPPQSTPQSIPTLSEWGILGLSVLLALAAAHARNPRGAGLRRLSAIRQRRKDAR